MRIPRVHEQSSQGYVSYSTEAEGCGEAAEGRGGGGEGSWGGRSDVAKPHKVGLFGCLCGTLVFIEGSSSLFCPFSYCTGPDRGADGTTKQPLLSVM